MKGVLGKVFTVGAFTSLSRVLGLVREMLQARLIGAGVEQSAFTLAFALPNMARKLFGEGALTAAFVPVFRSEVEEVGLARAARLARAVLTMMLTLLGAVVALALAALVGAQGFADALALAPRTRLTLRLVTILVPYMLAICGAAFGMGVLNALGRFKASSFMPALLNLLWIAVLGVLLFLPGTTPLQRITAVSSVILFGGFVQLAFMFRCMAKVGVSPVPSFSGWRAPKVRLVWRNTAIGALGAGAVQVNYMLDQVLAQCAAPWAAGVIGYAERLMDLPLGVVGVAFGTVLLPAFSALFAKKDEVGAREALVSSVRNLLFIMLPASVGLFVLAPEVTRVIYEGRAFDAVATARVARPLAVYALGLSFFGIQKTFVPFFQAQGDLKTPLRVSVRMVFLNAALNILAVVCLPVEWRPAGLAASTVLCAGLGTAMLAALARRKNGTLGFANVGWCVFGLITASLVLGAVVCRAKPLVADFPPVVSLAILVSLGALVYGALSLVLMKLRLLSPFRLLH